MHHKPHSSLHKDTLALFLCESNSKMKFAFFCVIVLGILSVALAVTMTTYSDAACTTVSTAANPIPVVVANLNSCTKMSSTEYVKPSACITGGKVAGFSFADAACTGTGTPFIADEGKCEAKVKITCDPASSVTLASIAVAAAVLAFCM